MSAPAIRSETGRLQSCILCAPGRELDAMVPRHIQALRQSQAAEGELTQGDQWQPNPDYLLFDDLVLLPQLASEHAQLQAVIAAATGDRQCLDFRDLLDQVLQLPGVRGSLTEEILDLELQLGADPGQLGLARGRLGELAPHELSEALLSGLDPRDDAEILGGPCPNVLFARDLWAVVGQQLVLGYPRARARKRDGVLARCVARHHPRLAGAQLLDIRADHRGRPGGLAPEELIDDRCVEGGDVLVVTPDTVLIGIGERTTLRGALAVARGLQGQGFRHVLGVQLPLARAMMHLDTVMTFVDRGLALAYLPALQGPEALRVVDLLDGGRALPYGVDRALQEAGSPVEWVPCGGSDPRAAAREQWSDGANAVCLAPGRIVLYGRNTATLRELNRRGFEVLTPAQFIANAEWLLQGGRRFVVALGGSELSRGRGGPRCLTLPLLRAG